VLGEIIVILFITYQNDVHKLPNEKECRLPGMFK
jgi:hypothetical protein